MNCFGLLFASTLVYLTAAHIGTKDIPHGNVTLKATIKCHGKNVAGTKVQFYDQDQWSKDDLLGQALTDENGVATVITTDNDGVWDWQLEVYIILERDACPNATPCTRFTNNYAYTVDVDLPESCDHQRKPSRGAYFERE